MDILNTEVIPNYVIKLHVWVSLFDTDNSDFQDEDTILEIPLDYLPSSKTQKMLFISFIDDLVFAFKKNYEEDNFVVIDIGRDIKDIQVNVDKDVFEKDLDKFQESNSKLEHTKDGWNSDNIFTHIENYLYSKVFTEDED